MQGNMEKYGKAIRASVLLKLNGQAWSIIDAIYFRDWSQHRIITSNISIPFQISLGWQ